MSYYIKLGSVITNAFGISIGQFNSNSIHVADAAMATGPGNAVAVCSLCCADQSGAQIFCKEQKKYRGGVCLKSIHEWQTIKHSQVWSKLKSDQTVSKFQCNVNFKVMLLHRIEWFQFWIAYKTSHQGLIDLLSLTFGKEVHSCSNKLYLRQWEPFSLTALV